ncbi:MAG TPA: GvpL/GvpF family gas vesicle protein [Jatrophihabitans sp.]|nr:GvpL/GvpF family gas vesicle protein [Jatrophihabitans sp.]
MTTGTYLYALCRPDAPQPAVRGVSGAPVRVVREGDVGALVSTVDLAEFGEQALMANLDDLSWLARVAQEHDAVVQACARVTTTAPLRLATICSDDESVRERLRQLSPAAVQLLAQLGDRQEWGVKLYAAVTVPKSGSTREASSGVAYLRERRDEIDRRAAAADAARRQADDIFTCLAGVAIDARRHRPQDPQLSGADAPMLLNASFLVEPSGLDRFRAAVDEMAAALPPDSLILTGPWPAYSFVSMEQL